MTKKVYMIGSLCILFLLAFAAMVHITNSINRGVIFDSRTVNESKEVTAFIAEYRVESISPSLSDSLSKYDLSQINLSKLEYWVEREWGARYEYLFFKKIYYGEDNKLLITDPSSLMPENKFYPSIKFAIKDTTEYNNQYSSGNEVLKFKVDGIPQTLILGVFIQTSYTDIDYIGDIVITGRLY